MTTIRPLDAAARLANRTLLMPDTGSAGDKRHRRCRRMAVASVPHHAFRPAGRLAETTIFDKPLAP